MIARVLPADHPARADVANAEAWAYRGANPPPDPPPPSLNTVAALFGDRPVLTASELAEIRDDIAAAFAHPPSCLLPGRVRPARTRSLPPAPTAR